MTDLIGEGGWWWSGKTASQLTCFLTSLMLNFWIRYRDIITISANLQLLIIKYLRSTFFELPSAVIKLDHDVMIIEIDEVQRYNTESTTKHLLN